MESGGQFLFIRFHPHTRHSEAGQVGSYGHAYMSGSKRQNLREEPNKDLGAG